MYSYIILLMQFTYVIHVVVDIVVISSIHSNICIRSRNTVFVTY